ncbi:uroporphyrinogen-III synthase [Spirillospora sp. CA-253888]
MPSADLGAAGAAPEGAGPLDGWRVLVPRAAHQGQELSWWLRRHGAVPWRVPVIAVEPPQEAAPLDQAIARLRRGDYAWVVFTSVNAVRAVHRRLAACGLPAQAMCAARVAAVGDRTAAMLARLGVRADLVPSTEQSAEGLLECWPDEPPGRVLLPRSDLARDLLVHGLERRGWRCDPVVAYRTVAAAPPSAGVIAAIAGGGCDAVAFTSSSTVRHLLALTGPPPPSTVIAAIGRQTAETAEEHGLHVRVVAPKPSAGELVAALAGYAAAYPSVRPRPLSRIP